MTVRRATDRDWPAILEVHRLAFGRDAEPQMADDVRASAAFVPELSLVATSRNQVAGHVMSSWVELEGSERRLLELGPIGVLPSKQGKGIGSVLVHETLRIVRELGEPCVVLVGNPAYYGRFGFERASIHGLLPPVGIPDEPFQVAWVSDERVRGHVVWPSTFA
ncbi:MAG: GNAT family N-acetyltransferase [Gaiellaceae bacterium]